jgi:3-isopropylmalate/(R)-2-methylmalate dehydratase small subunit
MTLKIASVSGTAVPVRGDDIDTDRIIPARFLRCVTFEGLEEHAFEDDRREAASRANGGAHPFDRPQFQGAAVLLVQRNFGCGSSREHAPQALARWGIRAVVGESFAEIFFGNCVALGLPCLTVSHDDIEKLMARASERPEEPFLVDLEGLTVSTPALTVRASMPRGARDSLVDGSWDATGLLLSEPRLVSQVAQNLPYVSGFPAR